jgi:hypothetical protein
MKSVSQLTDFYYKKLYPSLQKLEKERKDLKTRIIVIGVIFTTLAILLALAFVDQINFIIFAYIAIGAILYKYLIKDYTKEFKHKVIRPLINAIDENLNYSETLHVAQRHFDTADLFSTPDRLSGNDLVKGVVDGINIEFSDLHAEKKHEDSKNRTSYSTIFKGLFIVSDFNKLLKGQTVVLPDTAQSTFGNLIGNWLQSKNMARDELVKMDDVEFEKEFVVYSTDQIEARYILSPSLMKKLLTFKKKSKHPIHISFIGSHIYMAIEYNKDLFEPTVFSSLLDYKVAMEYVQTLHLAIGIVKELKLNEKLWSKI